MLLPPAEHNTKIISCSSLQLIAEELQKVADVVIGYFDRVIIERLDLGSKDRVVKVQLAAQNARAEWILLEKIYEKMENQKLTKGNGMTKLTPIELINQRIKGQNTDMFIESTLHNGTL